MQQTGAANSRSIVVRRADDRIRRLQRGFGGRAEETLVVGRFVSSDIEHRLGGPFLLEEFGELDAEDERAVGGGADRRVRDLALRRNDHVRARFPDDVAM
jgi:hypothetical protein